MAKPIKLPQLGDTVRDRISGYEGVVVAITDWLYGCRRITVQTPEMHEGKPVDSQCIDSAQCELVAKRSKKIGQADKKRPAGPRDGSAKAHQRPTQHKAPTR